MKLVNNMTATTIKNYSCFEAAPDHNFEDDGNNFKGYIYTSPNGNGSIVITTLRSCGETYLSIRDDYARSGFSFEDWIEQPEYGLANEFNGVAKIDLDKIAENCESILLAIKRLQAK